jgi:hypothetical protein
MNKPDIAMLLFIQARINRVRIRRIGQDIERDSYAAFLIGRLARRIR